MIFFEIFFLNIIVSSYSIVIFRFLNISKISFYERVFFGYFIISLIALNLHFFFPINHYISNFILITGIIILIKNYKIIKKKFFYQNLILTFFIILIIIYSYYQEDFPWYSIPFISYINFEKISFGISNIQFRFGHISILQYASSVISGSNFINKNLLLIPYAAIYSCFVLFGIKELFKMKKINFSNLFLFFTIIYSLIKFYRFSEFGNDIPAHIIYFYTVYNFLKIIENKDKDIINNFYLILICGFFCLMQKIQLGLVLLFPLIYFVFQFKKFTLNNIIILFILNAIIICPWLIKNIINTSCIIYPVEKFCIKSFDWSANNYNDHGNAKKVNIVSSAWSKGYPDQNSSNFLNHQKFISNFNWIKTWSLVNGKNLLMKLFPFSLILLILYLFNKKNKNQRYEKNIENLHKIGLLIIIFSTFMWFLIFPTFRYGTSIIVSLIILLYIFYILNNVNIKHLKIILCLSLSFLIINNVTRIYKNKNNYPYLTDINRKVKNITIINIGLTEKILIEHSKNLPCKYGKNICSHHSHILDNKVKSYFKNDYKYYIPN